MVVELCRYTIEKAYFASYAQHEETECPRLRNQETAGLSAGCWVESNALITLGSRDVVKKCGDGVKEVSTTAVVIIVLTRLCKNIFSHPCRRNAWG